METKILFVFLTFLVCAGVYRWIRKRADDPRLDQWTAEAVEWSDTGVSAVLLAFVIMSFLVQAFKIPSGSMQPTLLIGDHLFVNKFIYGTQVPFTLKRLWTLKPVLRQEVVVFLCPPSALSEDERKASVKKDFIKRAIGLPGDEIEIRNKTLYVNGQKADDPHANFASAVVYPKMKILAPSLSYQEGWEKGQFVYLPIEAVRDNFGPVKVPAGHYFVMGDNRDGSFDSRFWGPLPERYVKGKAWVVYWPFSRCKAIH
jgi:signal peptidase I